MRVLSGIVLAATVLWSGYWFAGSSAVQRGAGAWFEQAAAQGLVAHNGGLRASGYPGRFDLTVNAPDIVDPVSGYGWRGAQVNLQAMAWKPWHLTALLPDQQVITTPEGDITFTSTKLRATVILHPNADLALDRTEVQAADLAITTPTGTILAKSASLTSTEDNTRLHTYRIGLRLTDVALDPAVMSTMNGLPAVMPALTVDAHLLLSAALDRHAGDNRPELTGLILDALALDWGPLQVTATGSLAPTSDGSADGRLDFAVKNWRLLPAVVAAAGLVQPELAPTLLRALEVMAQTAGNPAILDVPLVFRSGRTYLGPLPVGAAPLLVQRQ